MIRINRKPGGRVIIDRVTTGIKENTGWEVKKKVSGVIVEKGDHEMYYHTCSGAYTNLAKHIIKKDNYESYAIKMDDGIVDIQGNNIIVVRDYNLKFLDRIEVKPKPVTEKAYINAKRIVERYESENAIP